MNHDAGTVAPSAALESLVEAFPSRPLRTREEIDALLARDREAFADAAIPLVGRGQAALGYRYLLARLLETGLLVETICNPNKLKPPEAVTLLRTAAATDAQFDIKLTRWLLDIKNREWLSRLGRGVEVLLDILGEASPGNRLLPLVVQFLRTRGERVSSKAAMMVAQRSQRVELALADSDPRVRANGIQALWGIDTQKARRILLSSLEDPNNRVVGNAILGLLRVGDRSVIPNLVALAKHPDPLFRATAAWVMGQSADPRFVDTLRELRFAGPDNVAASAERALGLFTTNATQDVVRQTFPVRILRLSGDRQGANRLSLLANLPPENAPSTFAIEVRIDGDCVEPVQLRRVTPATLTIGVLLPAVWPDDVHAALRSILLLRRATDRIAITRYSPLITGNGAPPAGTYAPFQGLHLLGTPAPHRIARVDYSLQPRVPPRVFREPAGMPSLFDALAALAAAPTRLAAPAGAVVFAAPGPVFESELPRELVDAVIGEADSHGCAIHAIIPPNLPAPGVKLFSTLCACTGGLLLKAHEPGESSRLTEVLHRNLTDDLEVSFRHAQPVSKLEVTVTVGAAQGSATLEFPSEFHQTPQGDRVLYA